MTKLKPQKEMGFVKLDLPCRKSSTIVASSDPEPHWKLDDLISELNFLELKLGSPSSLGLSSLKEAQCPDFSKGNEKGWGVSKPFQMSVQDDDMEDSESDSELSYDRMTGTRFSVKDIDLSESDGSDDELYLETTQLHLMDEQTLEKGFLFELENGHQQKVKEEVNRKIYALETDLKNEYKRFLSAIFRSEKYIEQRREMDRRLDKQFQRKIAEARDNHLSAVQRDHEQRSQIEERRIRVDAAVEEAKRKEKALQEEKVRQEKAKSELDARSKAARLGEEAQRAALEAARKASTEAAEKEAARTRRKAAAEILQNEVMKQNRVANAELPGEMTKGDLMAKEPDFSLPNNVQQTGIKVMAADAAIKSEVDRLKIYNEVAEKNLPLMLNSNKDFGKFERQIDRKIDKQIRQIVGTVDNVRAKARALIGIISDPQCPRSLSLMMFAKKVVSHCEDASESLDHIAFAFGHVIVLVTSQVPNLMDIVLTEFHKACIYTVPKHLQPSDLASQTKGYWKMLGYREENGEIESSDSYFERVESYMKLYAALIQTEIAGIRNPHGLKEAWAWLAMLLNALPANRATAVSMGAFLKMAGFALYRKYKSQFMKIVKVISNRYLPMLKERRDPKLNEIISKLESYLGNKEFLQEPEGWRLQSSLASREFAA